MFLPQEELDRKIFKIFYGIKSLNDSAELSDKMWVLYLYFGTGLNMSIYTRVRVFKCITQFFSQIIFEVLTLNECSKFLSVAISHMSGVTSIVTPLFTGRHGVTCQKNLNVSSTT